jgi:hypothetical protein
VGSATLTIETSSTTMNWTAQSSISASHLRSLSGLTVKSAPNQYGLGYDTVVYQKNNGGASLYDV